MGPISKVVNRLRFECATQPRALPVYLAAGKYLPKIRTFTSRDELWALYQLALALPRGAVALEIGSYLGASTCYLGAGLRRRGGHIYCVDTWENQTMPEGTRNTFEDFKNNTAAFSDLITTVRKRSSELRAEDIRTPVDFVFIDGDHSYEATAIDFRIAAPWVKPNCVLAFHDAVSYAFPGVPRVIGEALASGAWRIGGMVGNLVWVIRTENPLPPANNNHS